MLGRSAASLPSFAHVERALPKDHRLVLGNVAALHYRSTITAIDVAADATTGPGPVPSWLAEGAAPTCFVAHWCIISQRPPSSRCEVGIAGEPGGPTDGIERFGMPSFADRFSADQIASIVAYLKTLP